AFDRGPHRHAEDARLRQRRPAQRRRLADGRPARRPGGGGAAVGDGRYRRLSRPVLPPPGEHPVEYLATAFALPAWLVGRWLGRLDFAECLRWCRWFIATPLLWLRVNPLRTTRERMLEALASAGIAAEAGPHPQAIRLGEHAAI